jgi:hypothetical protein
LVRHGLIQGRQGACHLAQGLIQATIEEDDTQELRGCLDLLGPHKRFACACHLHGLRGEVLPKFLQERLWICQGQLHETLLLEVAGENFHLMQYALIFFDLQLILAQMAHAGRATPAQSRHLIRT